MRLPSRAFSREVPLSPQFRKYHSCTGLGEKRGPFKGDPRIFQYGKRLPLLKFVVRDARKSHSRKTGGAPSSALSRQRNGARSGVSLFCKPRCSPIGADRL